MTHYFLGLAQRTLGLRESLQPSIASMFEPGMLLMDDYVPAETIESEAMSVDLSPLPEPQYGQATIAQSPTPNIDAQFFFRETQPQLNEASFNVSSGIEQGEGRSFFDSITAKARERLDPVQRSELRSLHLLPHSTLDWKLGRMEQSRLKGLKTNDESSIRSNPVRSSFQFEGTENEQELGGVVEGWQIRSESSHQPFADFAHDPTIPAEWNSQLNRQAISLHPNSHSLAQTVQANLVGSIFGRQSYSDANLIHQELIHQELIHQEIDEENLASIDSGLDNRQPDIAQQQIGSPLFSPFKDTVLHTQRDRQFMTGSLRPSNSPLSSRTTFLDNRSSQAFRAVPVSGVATGLSHDEALTRQETRFERSEANRDARRLSRGEAATDFAQLPRFSLLPGNPVLHTQRDRQLVFGSFYLSDPPVSGTTSFRNHRSSQTFRTEPMSGVTTRLSHGGTATDFVQPSIQASAQRQTESTIDNTEIASIANVSSTKLDSLITQPRSPLGSPIQRSLEPEMRALVQPQSHLEQPAAILPHAELRFGDRLVNVDTRAELAFGTVGVRPLKELQAVLSPFGEPAAIDYVLQSQSDRITAKSFKKAHPNSTTFPQENYGSHSDSLAPPLVSSDRVAPTPDLGWNRAIDEAPSNRISHQNHTTTLNPDANQNIVSSIDEAGSDTANSWAVLQDSTQLPTIQKQLSFHSDPIAPPQTLHPSNRSVLPIVQRQFRASEDSGHESIQELASYASSSLNSSSQTVEPRVTVDASVLNRQDSRYTNANQPDSQLESRTIQERETRSNTSVPIEQTNRSNSSDERLRSPRSDSRNLHTSILGISDPTIIHRDRKTSSAQFSNAVGDGEHQSPEHTVSSSIRATALENQAKDVEYSLPNQEVWDEIASDTVQTEIEPTFPNHRFASQQSPPVLVKKNFAIAQSETTQPRQPAVSQTDQSISSNPQVQPLVQPPTLSRDRTVLTDQEAEFLDRIRHQQSNAPLSLEESEADFSQNREKPVFSDPAPHPPVPRTIAYFRPSLKLDDYLKRRQGGRS